MTTQKDNSGVLFQNHKRSTDRHPTMKGNCRIDGMDYWISGWTKQSESGEEFLSLAFSPKQRPTVQQEIDKNGDTPF